MVVRKSSCEGDEEQKFSGDWRGLNSLQPVESAAHTSPSFAAWLLGDSTLRFAISLHVTP
jgi:hypothetical protein